MTYKQFLHTPFWRRVRREKLRSTGHTCNRCHKKDTMLHVHHIYYRNSWFDVVPKDLEVLCADCHNLHHENFTLKNIAKAPPRRPRKKLEEGKVIAKYYNRYSGGMSGGSGVTARY